MSAYSRLFLLFATFLLLATSCGSEPEESEPIRRKSPIAIAKVTYDDTYVKIVYGQPYKNGRDIFGDLVPYGEVWRTGANEATELTATKAIQIGKKQLQPGTYALFTVPGKDQWTIILNSGLGQWGAFDYEQGNDVLRLEVPSSKTETIAEAFTIRFDEAVGDSTSIIMRWDQTEVKIPVEFMSMQVTGP